MATQTDQPGPEVLPARPRAGVGLHFTSLFGPYGIGDIADSAIGFIDQLNAMSAAVWQFLPTGPTAYGNSPYAPLSAFAGNENLIGIDPLVRAGLLSRSLADGLRRRPRDRVDYADLIPGRNDLFRFVAGGFRQRAGAAMKARFDEFLHRHLDRWLADYAMFRVLKTLHGEGPWTAWDTPYRRRDRTALARIRADYREQLETIAITQFLFDEQWQVLRNHAAQREVLLFGDMPIYVALDSADAWARREMLLVDDDGQPTHVAGVPPDYFSADGQLWGNPLYDWDYHAKSGFAWWNDRLRHATEALDLVRIDHFRGFESYWMVPWGAKSARAGHWVPGPGDALFRSAKQALGELPIVAENLGVITDAVEELRRRHGIPGMVVLQFALGARGFRMHDIDANSVCYTGTHDNDTTVGWFAGAGDDTRTAREVARTRRRALAVTGGSPETIHTDMIRLAFRTAARLAVAPLQDYLGLGSEARMNVPGTTANNWSWRLPPGLLNDRHVESIRHLIEASSRG